MEKKILDRVAIGIFVLLVVGSLWISLNISRSTIKISPDKLNWYRSQDVPEECRLPDYENDIEVWKKTLRYNQETWSCLKYFE